jgi:hypothetical protein
MMAATLSPEQIEARRKGARTINRPDALAIRLARSWPTIDETERKRVIALLRPLVAPEGGGRDGGA